MRILRDGQEVDPQVFGVVVPMQKGRRMDEPVDAPRNWWPLVGWLVVAAVSVSGWSAFLWVVTR